MQCLRRVCVCVCLCAVDDDADRQRQHPLQLGAQQMAHPARDHWLAGVFSVDCKQTWGQPCSSYAARAWGQERGKEMPPWPSRRSACSQAGNSMHVSVSGLVLLFALTQVRVDPELMLLQQEFQKQRFAMMACSVRMSQSPRSSAPARSPNSLRSP